MSKKERLDVLLVNRGLFESREKAKAAIMAGLIFIGTERIDKAGTKVDIEANLEVKGNTLPSWIASTMVYACSGLTLFPFSSEV